MTVKFDEFVKRVECICPRTLQTLRDNGTLAYSRINRKIYYKSEDLRRIVPVVEGKRKEIACSFIIMEIILFYLFLYKKDSFSVILKRSIVSCSFDSV